MKGLPWEQIIASYDDREVSHVIPRDDLRAHLCWIRVNPVDGTEFVSACWCDARVSDVGTVIHNALDRREDFETKGLLT